MNQLVYDELVENFDWEERFRAQDIQFLALLRSSTLVDLMRLERLEENQLQWRKCALDRAIWKAMLR